MRKALFPGTFDPPSLGHLDLIERALGLCDRLYVGIGVNTAKRATFTVEERGEMLEKICRPLDSVEVVVFDGLVVDFAKEKGIGFLVRGLRAAADFDYELQMALANRKLSGIETVFLLANPLYAHVSSTLIREVAKMQHRLKDFVPEAIEAMIFERLSSASGP